MATAFASLTRLFDSCRALLACFAPRPVAEGAPPVRAVPQAPALPVRKPLRVVRVLEPSASRSIAGRMVISGRLADVCAELDRLAAMEAQGC